MKKFKYIVIFIIAVIGVIVVFKFMGKQEKGYDSYKVFKADINKVIEASGTIKAGNEEIISIPTSQKVLKVLARENQKVSKNQVLLKLDTGELNYQLQKSVIAGKQLQDDIYQLKNTTLISDFQSIKNKLVQTKSDYDDAVFKLQDAEGILAKDNELLNSGAISQEDYNAQVKTRNEINNKVIQAKAAYSNAQSNYNDYDKNRKINIAAKERQYVSNQADVESIQKKISDSIIRAAVSGTVAELDVKEGSYPESGSTVRIYDFNSFKFEAYVPQEDAVNVKVGQVAQVSINGLDKKFNAVVSDIRRYAEVDSSSGSKTPKVKLILNIKDKDARLSAGFDADAEIYADKIKGVTVLRRESVKSDNSGKNFVFVISGNTVLKKYVDIGISDEYNTEIKHGVNVGDTVISNPGKDVKEGTKAAPLYK